MQGDFMIFITAKFRLRPEHADNWPEISGPFTRATRSEPGCKWFDWSRSLADPNEYVLVEAFQDGAAAAAHVQSAHFKEAQQTLPQYLAADAADRELHRPAGRLVGAGRDGGTRPGELEAERARQLLVARHRVGVRGREQLHADVVGAGR